MSLKKTIIFCIVIASCFLNSLICFSQNSSSSNEVEVALRLIGHEVLLKSGDSTSRVMPIKKENSHYRIEFESNFQFKPDELVATIDDVIKKTNLVDSYIIEVEQCDTKNIVYSFKVDYAEQSDIIPCIGRVQPKACYSLLVKLNGAHLKALNSKSESNLLKYMLFGLIVLILVVAGFKLYKKKSRLKNDPNLIPLGSYLFDKKNTELIIEEQRIELTSKEADLLLLLYNTVNTTVERDVILNTVWGDEGNYVGRTLDVFISKLRKKLEFDSQVKIVNIRGVGYKLVMDV